jgi:hypothetical protein
VLDPYGPTKYVVARALNGSSLIILVSAGACIVANIATQYGSAVLGREALNGHVRQQMQTIRELVELNAIWFSGATVGFIIVEVRHNAIARPEKLAIILQVLNSMGIYSKIRTYNVMVPSALRTGLEGALVVKTAHPQMPVVVVEGDGVEAEQASEAEDLQWKHTLSELGYVE